jgi:hypothetical protein
MMTTTPTESLTSTLDPIEAARTALRQTADQLRNAIERDLNFAGHHAVVQGFSHALVGVSRVNSTLEELLEEFDSDEYLDIVAESFVDVLQEHLANDELVQRLEAGVDGARSTGKSGGDSLSHEELFALTLDAQDLLYRKFRIITRLRSILE